MSMSLRQVSTSALMLVLFAALGTSIVAFVHTNTAQRIAENERAQMLHNLNAIIPQTRYDNQLLNDIITVDEPSLNAGLPVTVYRARMGGKPVAAIMTLTAPDGYSGPIKLLVGIYHDNTVAGVRVITHRETPGLGDQIDLQRSDWILGFTGSSLGNPVADSWACKRDGGVFDQFTGATITPRAVINAVKSALVYFEQHQDELFAQTQMETLNV